MQFHRKVFHGSVLTGAVVLVAAGASFACVIFKGSLAVQVPGTDGTTVTGDSRDNASHKYCTAPATAGSAGRNDTITVTVAATGSTSCDGGSKMASGNKSVRINNATSDSAVPFVYGTPNANEWNFVSGTGCFASDPPPSGTFTVSDTFNVNSSGAGSATYTLNTAMNRVDPTDKASALCVGTSGVGIFAPLIITSI